MRRRNLANIYDLGVKELCSLWRDPMMLVLIVYVSPRRSTPGPRPCRRRSQRTIAIVDEDNSALSSGLPRPSTPRFTRP